jgi:alpha-L-fucosidase 2
VTRHAAGNLVTLDARFEEGFPFAAVASVAASGGTVAPEEAALRVEGADSVVILVAMATGAESPEPVEWARRQLARTAADFDALRSRHVADHRQFYSRVKLSLGDDRYQRLFDFGRYLMISASRPGGLPMNLQGIWNDQARPPWDSDFHMDLNLEFNYWPAEVANLSELHQPLFDWIEARMPDARRFAADVFGCRGIFFPLVGDATGLTNLDNIAYSWPGNAGWLAQHFWRHWEYTGDREFLRRRAWPFLKETAAFYLDYLQKDDRGKYRILPSCSPENGIKGRKGWPHFTTVSSTIDLEIAREVFTNLVEASAILGVDRDQVPRWREVLANLPEPRIDAAGRMVEWSEDVEAQDPAHRHLSPLYGLFPGDRIATSGSMDSARKLLEYRLQFGEGSANGWSYPWRAALFARLGEGDRALEQLDAMARCCLNDNLLSLITDFRGRGGTVNWFGSKKVFQIEAGLATTAAIAEMLLQSHGGVLRILPALPSRWPSGRVAGLAARGGFVADIDWSGGRAAQVSIHSRLGNRCRMKLGRAPARIVLARNAHPVAFQSHPDGSVEFATRPGQDYRIE